MNALREECQQLRDELIALRREFHRDPELGLHEYHTATRIERELDRCAIPHERVGETAVVGHLTGNGNGSGLVVLRADIDALPIQETNDVPYRSQTPGMMHACGHDAHTTCLLGAAKVLSAHRADFGGEVRFLFQPAEEIGQGARPLIAAGCTRRPTFPRGPSASSRGPTTRASTTLSSASTAKARTSPRRSSAWMRSISQASSSSRSSPSSRA